MAHFLLPFEVYFFHIFIGAMINADVDEKCADIIIRAMPTITEKPFTKPELQNWCENERIKTESKLEPYFYDTTKSPTPAKNRRH